MKRYSVIQWGDGAVEIRKENDIKVLTKIMLNEEGKFEVLGEFDTLEEAQNYRKEFCNKEKSCIHCKKAMTCVYNFALGQSLQLSGRVIVDAAAYCHKVSVLTAESCHDYIRWAD